MKFLLFFVSLVYSTIFYIFASLSKGKDIFGNTISNSVDFVSFSPNLLIESFIFLLIGIFFIYLFSDLKYKGQTKIVTYKTEFSYFLFYIILIFYAYFFNNGMNFFIITIVLIFVLSDFLFNHLSNIKAFFNYKTDLRYVGIIINYFSSILSIYYIFNNNIAFIPFIILVFNIIFNILIHKKYTNYISLSLSILTILFLFYSLFFSIFELYISYI